MNATTYLDGIKKQFLYYKSLGEKTIDQVPDEHLFWQYNEESNSIVFDFNCFTRSRNLTK